MEYFNVMEQGFESISISSLCTKITTTDTICQVCREYLPLYFDILL